LKKFLIFFFVLGSIPLSNHLLAATATASQYLSTGNIVYAQKDYAMAVRYYQAAVQMDPNNSAAYLGLGNSYYSLGQKDQALIAYQKASALDPNNIQLSSFINTLKNQLGNSPALTPASKPTVSSSGMEIDLNAGLDDPISPAGYGLSFGGGAACYFGMGPEMGLGASLEYYSFAYSSSGSSSELELLANLKYKFGVGGSRPYLLLGAGLSDYNDPVDGSVMNPAAGCGLGYEFNIGTKMNAFIEAKAVGIFASNTTVIHVPLQIGINFNL
jgi:tetratricopeptide (TPR) repeat protein